MKTLYLLASIISIAVVSGCSASTSEVTPAETITNTTSPEVDVALQGTWAGTGGEIIGTDTTVAMTINNGTLRLTIDEPIEREIITAQYNVQSLEQQKFLLTLSQVTVDIEHYGSDSQSVIDARIQEHTTEYTTSLAKVTIDLVASNQLKFYPGENTQDAVTLYRQ